MPAPPGGIRANSAGVRRPIDAGGLSGLACRSSGPARSTREKVADVHCGIGLRVRVGQITSWDGGHEGGDRRRRSFVLPILGIGEMDGGLGTLLGASAVKCPGRQTLSDVGTRLTDTSDQDGE